MANENLKRKKNTWLCSESVSSFLFILLLSSLLSSSLSSKCLTFDNFRHWLMLRILTGSPQKAFIHPFMISLIPFWNLPPPRIPFHQNGAKCRRGRTSLKLGLIIGYYLLISFNYDMQTDDNTRYVRRLVPIDSVCRHGYIMREEGR